MNVELVSGFLTITQPREIAMYEEGFTQLAQVAVYGKHARALIANAISVIG